MICFLYLYKVLSASHNGKLRCKVETDEVTATTHFSNLELEDEERQPTTAEEEEDEEDLTEARIDIQKLVTFLNVQQFNANKVYCGIVHGQAVHMFLQCTDMSFQYFIPAMNVSIL